MNKAMHKKLIIGISLLLSKALTAQTPDLYPPPVPEPVKIDFFNIILYVVLPLLVIVVFLWYRRWIRNKNKKEDGQNKDKTQDKQF